jgi:hypothetical protein
MTSPTEQHMQKSADLMLPNTARPGSFRRMLRAISESKTLMVGLALILFWVAVSILAPGSRPTGRTVST